MEKMIINLPSVRDDKNGYVYLIKLVNQVLNNPRKHFDINFRNCAILEQNAVAILGGLAQYINTQNTLFNKALGGVMIPQYGVMFLVDTMSEIISNNLIENNFLAHFSQEKFSGYPSGSYIGYRQHTDYLDADEIAFHLDNEWLSSEKIKLSNDLKSAIVSRIFEIFMNAYGHGADQKPVSGLGVMSCGQYNKKEGKLKLTVLDFGEGIVQTVKTHVDSKFSDIEAMEWALIAGNSTRTDSQGVNLPRGLGFELLSDFVSLNKGSFSVYSNGCCAYVNEEGRYEVSLLKTPLNGTMVNISINCDDRYYKFIAEDDELGFFF
ncbi:MAG: hypothetical protein COB22_03240 [Cycloclasticus sp.]|nr:MAG: hypothetical protein COB22_03240 [Cycloclasticus sp.]